MTHSMTTTLISAILLIFSIGASADDAAQCTRDWAKKTVKNSSFKVVGLGLSTKGDPTEATSEARSNAIKDILLQLQSSVQSKSELHSTESSHSASSDTVLTAKIDDLHGLKPTKSGSNSTEKITHCEVYEFDVEAAYREASSPVQVFLEKIEGAADRAASSKGLGAIKDFPEYQKSVAERDADFKRADIFKTVLGAPGPGLVERAQRALGRLEESARLARTNVVFILPSDEKFADAMAALQGSLANSGVKTASSKADAGDSALLVNVEIKEIGKAKKSKTRLGLTVTRKVQVRLLDARSNSVLGANRGLSVVGTSASNDEDQANDNSDSQITAGVFDTIRAFMPSLLKKD